MIAVIVASILVVVTLIGVGVYFTFIKDETGTGTGAGTGTGTGTARPGERNNNVNVPGSESTTVRSNTGGLDSAPQPSSREYTPIVSSRKPFCEASICTGEKVLRSSTRRGDTIDECCRDKSCQIDWNPDRGGDPEQCTPLGMVFDEEYTKGRDGKTNEECCKEDTTSYSKWCVQEVAYKADGTTEKTKSPNPDSGGDRDLMPGGGDNRTKADYRNSKIAGGTRLFNYGTDKETALSRCKNKCDSISECHGFWLENNGNCYPRKALNENELYSGYEKNMSNEEDMPAQGGEFYIKSTFVPSHLRKQTINGELKVAGIDEEFCPLNYISIYGSEKWSGGYSNKHVMPNKVEGSFRSSNGSTCFGPGGTKNGVQLYSYVNSHVPIINSCSKLCNKYDDCGGFWVDYTNDDRYARCHEETSEDRRERCNDNEISEDGHGGARLHAGSRGWKWFSKPNGNDAMRNKIGRCCLKGDITDASASYMNQPAQFGGAYFVRVRDGVMGDRPWRKSIGEPKS